MNSKTAFILSVIAWALLCIWLLTAPAGSVEDDPPETEPVIVKHIPDDDIPATEYAYYDGPLVYYEVTAEDRETLQCIVQGEAGGESYEGKRWVATCLLNAMRLDGLTADAVRKSYQYAGWSEDVSDETIRAVSAVFDDGDTTHDTVLWFYAPKLCNGTWHETQRFVCEVGNHRFFCPKEGAK